MSPSSATKPMRGEDSKQCLARSVVEALDAEPTLEAVTINRTRQTIAVATLGKTDEPRLVETVTGRIKRAYEHEPTEHCRLLQIGRASCRERVYSSV